MAIGIRLNAKRSRDQTFVTISIGDAADKDKQVFMLHRELLCSHSPYFAGAFQGKFRESEDRSIYLPDVTDSTMRLFQFWLYRQSTVWSADYIDSNNVSTKVAEKDDKSRLS